MDARSRKGKKRCVLSVELPDALAAALHVKTDVRSFSVRWLDGGGDQRKRLSVNMN